MALVIAAAVGTTLWWLQAQATVMSYLDAVWLMGAVLLGMIALVFLLRRPAPSRAAPVH